MKLIQQNLSKFIVEYHMKYKFSETSISLLKTRSANIILLQKTKNVVSSKNLG